MKTLTRWFWLMIGYFRPKAAASNVSAVPVVRDVEPIQLPAKPKRHLNQIAEQSFGVFWHLEDLLRKKDDYFYYLGRLKRQCPEAYAMYSKLGGQLIPESSLLSNELGPEWRSPDFKRPAFGMVAIFTDEDDARARIKWKDDAIYPKLEFFCKTHRFKDIQPVNERGDIYEITMFYALRKGDKFSGFVSFHVHVDESGNVRALKHWEEISRTVRSKKDHTSFNIVCRGWKYPASLEFVFNEYRKKYPGSEVNAVDTFAAFCFRHIVTACQYSASGVRVNLYQKGLTGVFNVETTRTPYFFKDREKVVSQNGRTARIFHAVMPHERRLKGGKTTNVHYHFRGLRRFNWNGAEVLITVPGKHHLDLMEFDVAGHDVSEFGPGEEAVYMRDIGRMWGKHVKGMPMSKAFEKAPRHIPSPESQDLNVSAGA